MDPTFPWDNAIRWDEHPSDSHRNLSIQRDKVTWVESLDIRYSEPENSLFGIEH